MMFHMPLERDRHRQDYSSPEGKWTPLEREIAVMKEAILRMERSRSMRWTAPVRRLESIVRRWMHRFFCRLESIVRRWMHRPPASPKTLPSRFPPGVFAIIPTNARDLLQLEQCLETLFRASSGIRLRTVVVVCPCEGIDENTVRGALHHGEELLFLTAPFSFGRSNNAALRLLRNEECILFLNDDCFFRGDTDIRLLSETLFIGGYACVGPWIEHLNYAYELPPSSCTNGIVHITQPLVGACVLWNTAWQKCIGLFDESFDGYGQEEADISLRALRLGGRWVRDDRVTVDHVHHASFGDIKGMELNIRNIRRWKEKYPGINGWGKGPPWEENLLPLPGRTRLF